MRYIIQKIYILFSFSVFLKIETNPLNLSKDLVEKNLVNAEIKCIQFSQCQEMLQKIETLHVKKLCNILCNIES